MSNRFEWIRVFILALVFTFASAAFGQECQPVTIAASGNLMT